MVAKCPQVIVKGLEVSLETKSPREARDKMTGLYRNQRGWGKRNEVHYFKKFSVMRSIFQLR